MKANLLYLSTLIIFCISCAPKILVQDAFSHRPTIEHQKDVDINIRFAGDALNYLTFEIDIDNHSDQPVILSRKDISMELDLLSGEYLLLKPLDKERVIMDLQNIKEQTEQEKKRATRNGVLFAALDIATIATTGTDVALLAGGSAADILNTRDRYKALEGSLEDQIAYVYDWVLEQDTIPAGSTKSLDILFESGLYTGQSAIKLKADYGRYTFPYTMSVVERKL